MSDEYHRPTLTFPSGAYNATQVRLYGIAPQLKPIFPGDEGASINQGSITFKTLTSGSGYYDQNQATVKNIANSIGKYIAGLGKDDRKNVSTSDLVGLISAEVSKFPLPIPLPIPVGLSSQIPIDMKEIGTVVISVASLIKDPAKSSLPLTCGIIVGYAYEGHTYDLPKPKIMLIPAVPQNIPNDDSGYNKKMSEGYLLWIVDKLDQCVEFEMNQGFIEQLVLEANLPGKRAPTSYAGRASLGHRSGKLGE